MTGRELRSIRRRLGWSQHRMAENLGVHYGTLIRYEQGQLPVRPTVERLVKLIAALEFASRERGSEVLSAILDVTLPDPGRGRWRGTRASPVRPPEPTPALLVGDERRRAIALGEAIKAGLEAARDAARG